MEDQFAYIKYLPIDKSWIIRMGVLDMLDNSDNIQKFLEKQANLSDDLLALQRASRVWKGNEPVNIGESGTLYRFLRFASWKLNLNKKFVISGTLKNRKLTNNPDIVDLSQEELLKLDNNTSQWASAKVLLGDRERLDNPPYKLKLTYEAVEHWELQKNKGEGWIPRLDETILRQAQSYRALLKGLDSGFYPIQAEDFCFAYGFGLTNSIEGEKKWPNLHGHESDRIKEIETMLEKAKKGMAIDSKDHRVVQAIAMWAKVNDKKIQILYPDSVNKSWPRFWEFLSLHS